jgi:carbonic anhydrase
MKLKFSTLASVTLLGSLLFATGCHTVEQVRAFQPPEPVAPEIALDRLKEGNKRFVAGTSQNPRQSAAQRMALAKGQWPFAIVLGCADSRTSPDLVFDQGLGDLFIVRVAGNVANHEGLGSIEYAVQHLGSRLIVVLGHESCGAVKAAKAEASGHLSPHLDSLLKAIKPAVNATAGGDLETAVRANVQLVVSQIRSNPELKKLFKAGTIKVVGAYYDLDSGVVSYLP